jgi:hypothetical protein
LQYNDSSNLILVEIPMGDIFISYSRTDTDYAHKLVENLQSRGLHIWIDERLDDRVERLRKLKKHIDSCDAFIVIMTPHAFASKRVQRELLCARQTHKPIFPLWLEGAEPWFTSELTQFYDVRGDQLPKAQFYSALEPMPAMRSVAPTSAAPKEFVSVKTPLPSMRRKSSGRVAIIMVRLAIFALMVGAITFGKPSGQKFLDSLSASLNVELAPTPVGTPEPKPVTRKYEISLCCGYPGSQRSALLNFSVSVETIDVLQIEFDMASDLIACSDLFLHVLWDNVEIYVTHPIGPLTGKDTTGSINLSSHISQGRHMLTISPEGIAGGCNAGGLPSWMGKLIVHVSSYPK